MSSRTKVWSMPVVGGGARYLNGSWARWDPRDETDAKIKAFLDGTHLANAGPTVPSGIPSSITLVDEFVADGAVDWFPYFLSAVTSAGTYQLNGQTYVNDFAFSVPFSSPVSADGVWYHHVEALAFGEVPGPSALALLCFGVTGLIGRAVMRTRKR